jgi:hypothetical protein
MSDDKQRLAILIYAQMLLNTTAERRPMNAKQQRAAARTEFLSRLSEETQGCIVQLVLAVKDALRQTDLRTAQQKLEDLLAATTVEGEDE